MLSLISLLQQRRHLRPGRLLGTAQESGGQSSVLLLDDDFTTDDAAPIATPRAAEPGPGQTSITGTGSSLSASKFTIDIAGVSEGPFNATSAVRSAGLAVFAFGLNLSRNSGLVDVGFNAGSGVAGTTGRPLVRAQSSSLDMLVGGGNVVGADSALSTGANYDVCCIADADGGYGLFKLSSDPYWTLFAVGRIETTTPIFGRVRCNNVALTLDRWRMGYPFFPTRWFSFPLGGANGTITLPAADFVSEIRITDTADNGLKFRIVDANNYFVAERTNAGALRIRRFDAGSPTTVVTTAMTAAANDRVFVRLRGSACKVWAQASGGTAVSLAVQTITQHTTGTGIAVSNEAAYDSFYVYPALHRL